LAHPPGIFDKKLARIIRFILRRWLPVLAAFWLAVDPGAAQEIGKLYATRPPPGYAFIRVAVGGDLKASAKLRIDAVELSVGENEVASRYRAVRADKPVKLSIDGATVAEGITPLPDKFYTLVVSRSGAGWNSFAIDEGQDSANDLKAQLRFFNLIAGCEASLKVAEGPSIFDAATFGSVKSRAINPVQAQLEASCNGHSAPSRLPQLRAGDHYSLFFREVGGEPALSGQFDETEPYRER
jgi:alginate O-acetyltransferase complex protein AlgF